MSQTVTAPVRDAAQEDHFGGIGPHIREPFRLASPPAARLTSGPPQEQAAEGAPGPFAVTEMLDQRAYVSARWCDIGISLIVLVSGAAALFRLICLGQP